MPRTNRAKRPSVEVGQTYGRLTVIDREKDTPGPDRKWICRCLCGNESSHRGQHLQQGSARSCGCLRRELTSVRGKANTIHGNTRLDRSVMDRKRWVAYKLTPEMYAELLAAQGGGCAICGVPSGPTRPLNVDHDHSCCPSGRSCGKCVRGLLCGSCNSVLGFAKDDPARLRASAIYLESVQT